MISLLVIGFIAGGIAGISPCILPVLPIVLVGASTPEADPLDASKTARRRRAIAIVGGLVVSFSVLTLAGSAIISTFDLPEQALRDAGLVLLGLFGCSLLIPRLALLLERPFARLRVTTPRPQRSGFLLGCGLGAVFTPCAGPVLATITVVGSTHHLGWSSVALTVAFGCGVAVPLLFVAGAGAGLGARLGVLKSKAPLTRRIGGAVLIVMTLLIGFNLTDGLQRAVPGYTSALQKRIEGSPTARKQLAALTKVKTTTRLVDCVPDDPVLENCGAAPNFAGVTAWLNTPGGRPLSISDLRHKVVLVDFWTYSCINCQRALPHVEAWYARYKADGLVVVGVHTPEFSFEHVVGNVRTAASALGVHYPVAIDDAYDTWDAYDNEYWPADYLIDASGNIRFESFGEGNYTGAEEAIRSLLVAAHPGIRLPPPTTLPDTEPTSPTTPETYLGTDRLGAIDGSTPVAGVAEQYNYDTPVPLNEVGFAGRWTFGAESDLTGPNASIALHFEANDVYLVLGGTGTLTVDVGPRHETIAVRGIPRLYTLYSSQSFADATLVLHATPGIEAYDFTFG